MTVSPSTTPINSTRYTVKVPQEKYTNSSELGKLMNKVVKRLATDINVYLSLEYDPATSKFNITFPASNLVTLSLNLTDELCGRMGYSGVFAITRGLTPESMAETGLTPGKPITDVK